MDFENKFTIQKLIVYTILILIGQTLLGVMFSFIYGVIYSVIYQLSDPGIDTDEIAQDITSSYTFQILLIFVSQAYFFFIAVIIKNKYNNNLKGILSLRNSNILLLVYIIMFSLFYLIPSSEIENLIASFTGRMNSLNEILLNISQKQSISGLFIAVILIAMLPAFIEELLFRGLIQKNLSLRHGNKTALIVTSIIFALIHVNPSTIISIFLLSLMLGYLYIKTNNLLYPMVLHFLNNVITVIILRYNSFEIKGLNTSLEKIEHTEFTILVPCIILTLLCVYAIVKLKIKNIGPINN